MLHRNKSVAIFTHRKKSNLLTISFFPFFLILSALILSGCSGAKSAPLGYRYWGYSLAAAGIATWTSAMAGPATTRPENGSVEGWNYTFAAEGAVDPSGPLSRPDFATLCKEFKAGAGQKLVGIVIEYGNVAIHPADDLAPEPTNGCVIVAENATGLDVLAKAAEVRVDERGMICGINNFPTLNCGEEAIPTPASLLKK